MGLSSGLARCHLFFLHDCRALLNVILIISGLATDANVDRGPVAGGEYHWAALLAPKFSQQFLSYFTGCITVVGWQALITSSAYEVGSLIDGLFYLVWPSHSDMSWRVWLLLWTVLLVAVLTNTIIGAHLPRFEIAFLTLQGLGFLVTIIPLVSASSHQSASHVFTSFVNDGGWSSQTLSFWVGIVGNVFAFLGMALLYNLDTCLKKGRTGCCNTCSYLPANS